MLYWYLRYFFKISYFNSLILILVLADDSLISINFRLVQILHFFLSFFHHVQSRGVPFLLVYLILSLIIRNCCWLHLQLLPHCLPLPYKLPYSYYIQGIYYQIWFNLIVERGIKSQGGWKVDFQNPGSTQLRTKTYFRSLSRIMSKPKRSKELQR